MDDDLQALLRAWAASGSDEDGVRAARARQRAGLLPEEHGRLAATLGDPVALALGSAPLPLEPVQVLARWGQPEAARLRTVLPRVDAPVAWSVFADLTEHLLGMPHDDGDGPDRATAARIAERLRAAAADRAMPSDLEAAAAGVDWHLVDGDVRDLIMEGRWDVQGARAVAMAAAAAAHGARDRALDLALMGTKHALLVGPGWKRWKEALGAGQPRDERWLERRLAMTLLFGPGALPPVDPWRPVPLQPAEPAPEAPARARARPDPPAPRPRTRSTSVVGSWWRWVSGGWYTGDY